MVREPKRRLSVVPSGPLQGVLKAPGSKSVSNRLLVIAALAAGRTELTGVLASQDTRVMAAGLSAFGARLSPFDQWGDEGLVVVDGTAGSLEAPKSPVSAGLSGTTMRFLACVALLARGTVTLDGGPPLRRRPIAGLLDALRALGARVEADDGRPPLRSTSSGVSGGRGEVDAAQSSQFVTGLLLVSPYAEDGLTVVVEHLGAAGYVALTVQAMGMFGVEVDVSDATYDIRPTQTYRGRRASVEYDASAAAHLFALAMATGPSTPLSFPSVRSLSTYSPIRFWRPMAV